MKIWHVAWAYSLDKQNGYAACTCSMDMDLQHWYLDMQHGHGYVAWTWTCTTDIYMKQVHGHAAQTWTYSIDMACIKDMDKQFRDGHAALTWACRMGVDIQGSWTLTFYSGRPSHTKLWRMLIHWYCILLKSVSPPVYLYITCSPYVTLTTWVLVMGINILILFDLNIDIDLTWTNPRKNTYTNFFQTFTEP